MADLKRKILYLSSGKQLKLYGNSLAIGKSLEIGEGYAPNIFSCTADDSASGKPARTVSNPHQLSAADLQELADYNIRLWMDSKDNVRKHGVDNPKIFNPDALR
jgi:hypothetical protein